MLSNVRDGIKVFQTERRTDSIEENILEAVREQSLEEEDAIKIGESNTIQVLIAGQPRMLEFINSDTLTLGREYMYHTVTDMLDLDDYDAVNAGVSRSHCRLTFKWGQLFVTDLDSTNGTYIDDKRLQPFQPYIIKSGAILRLGKLSISFPVQ